MDTQKITSFNIIGIAVRTTNENSQAAKDIPALWNKFMSENILQQIPNKVDNTIYCMYTEYEKDHTKPYTTLLGCKVENLENIPTGMIGKTVEGGNYIKQTVKGNLMQGVIANAWVKIWNANFSRLYTADFEVYGEKAQNPENAEVDIFIAVK
ncbi:MAG TPA: GyrI-like domain-containing protein [Chitinophagaceae bacterium]|nr:GyrI-like domain-containing protein [Chitinophagaceae bacterium]